MTLLIWNVRGFNDPLKQKRVVARIRSLKIQIVCLLETRVKENNSQVIIARHFQGWKWLHNYSSAYNGRIWILWNDQQQVNLVDTSAQSITGKVVEGSKQFYLTVTYGFNDGIARRDLWSKLEGLQGICSQSPWVIAGDFNVIAHPNESSSYDGSQGVNMDMRDFQDSLKKVAVFDHSFNGPNFTWSNHQGEGFVVKKLDRVLINDKWHLTFANSAVEFLSPGDSDHCPALVKLDHPIWSPPKPFKVFNF